MSGRPSRWKNEPTCLACPAERPAHAHRYGWRGPWCRNCADRWDYHGRPASGPPPSRQRVSGPRYGRVEDYAELRAQGESLEQAAARVGGVCKRTAERYQAALREMAAAGSGAAAWPGERREAA